RMVMRAASVDRTTARDLLDAASGSVKLAIVMAWLACDALRARNELERHGGKLGAVRPLS
ncbi:MAG TPA: hypothetical protein VMV73_01850, partial [Candidatus Dormibacteraeota bacterium]|nr:hypothetical protein [Candidatus Dormibacteraeota bacterium]